MLGWCFFFSFSKYFTSHWKCEAYVLLGLKLKLLVVIASTIGPGPPLIISFWLIKIMCVLVLKLRILKPTVPGGFINFSRAKMGCGLIKGSYYTVLVR